MKTRIVSLLGRPLLGTCRAASADLVARTNGRYPLDSARGLRPHNVVAEPATLQGKKGIKVLPSQESAPPGSNVETLLIINDLEFSDLAVSEK
jgi:hypothetical protein